MYVVAHSVLLFMLPAMAVDSTVSTYDPVRDLNVARHYAYMDMNTADDLLKVEIQQARNALIFRTGWVTDGVKGYVHDENGNIIEELPQFYDLFPSEWEIPEVPEYSLADAFEPQQWSSLRASVDAAFDGTVTLQQPTDGVVSSAFCKVSTSWNGYTVTQIDTIGYNGSSAKYNVSYTNTATKKSLGYKNNLTSGQGFTIYPPKNITVGVHASSYSDPGEWTMQVYCHRS